MKKYRIVQEEGYLWPQKKRFGFWMPLRRWADGEIVRLMYRIDQSNLAFDAIERDKGNKIALKSKVFYEE